MATTLRYYRSTDAAITRSDTEVGTDAVAELAASGTSRESMSLTAPSTAGTYYYGACVDAVTGESETTNNCSSSVQIDVPEPEPQVQRGPNLAVASPSVSNSGPAAGTTFTLSATVRNDGSEPSAATMLRYYRSTDATITTSDTGVGMGAVAGLAASGISSLSLDVSAPSNPGTYYYGACVGAVAGESDTTNNCSPSVQIKVPEPDLVVASPSVSNSAPAAGATFTLSATVRNDGDESSAATTMRFYRSTDAAITASDTEVGTAVVTGLDTAGSSSRSARSGSHSARLFATSEPGTYYYHGEVELNAPSTPGTYYYGACVDAVTDESATTNNCSSSVPVTVRSSESQVQGTPDLETYAIVASTGLDGFTPGVSFTLSVRVRNNGSGSAAATTLRYYRSTDATITTSATEVGTDDVPGLAPSGTSTQSMNLNAPSTRGTYYYGACVDAVTDESDTTNNCIARQIDVREESQGAPDLVVAAPTVSDSGPDAGATFTLSATVRNDGDETSAATTLRYYRSTDATITTSDTQEDTEAVAELAASGSSSESVSLTAPSTPGTYYYGACADAVTDESDTTNNCSSSVQVEVATPPSQSNLIPSAPTSFRHECVNTICTTVEFKWSPPTQGLPLLRYEFYLGGLWVNEEGDIHALTDQQGDVVFLVYGRSTLNGTYTVKARAVNEHGTGPEASLTYMIPPEELQEEVPPTQVTSLEARCYQSCNTVSLSWNPPKTGLPITRYEVWASNHPQWQAAETDQNGNPYDHFSYNDDDWDEGTYEYKIRASNPHGTGPEASVSIERSR